MPAAPNAFAARVGEALVVLDLEADRYFLALAEGAVPHEDAPETAARFQFDPQAASWRPRGSTHAEGTARTGASLASLFCLRRISQILRRRSFERLVESIRTAPLSARPPAFPPEMLLASFEAVRPFYPARRLCRLDAPALCLLFRRAGHGARLVFGARLQPFAAHCWAELDGLVLNEAAESVSQYTPLLIV